ncbi:amidase [Lusitaniella coriacea LEGE 07157]|uniref:Amidase n=1 Tax=Lusitaniella coriacea LEGE 07157 TaxID=945747 RepID=A0A8J7AM49_9CYAN|nr:amidase family protein [Lusitaniella coriacea]MBE9114363.1 amidase [Lusitaniella coriacea LEGE 07157]
MLHLKKNVAVEQTTPTAFSIFISKVAKTNTTPKFQLSEATIVDLNCAFEQGILTAEQLVEQYMNRIKTYDKSGLLPLNSIIQLNPNALEIAQNLDRERQISGARSALHGIPIIVKDNYNTFDLPTTAGSRALARSIPPEDSFIVKKLRSAGAIILAKANMAEFAWTPNQTVSSILGTTRNPYDLSRVPAGSSGGTAAAIAANFGTVGLGTDTGNSIRGPAAHTALVGLRPTMGLTSRNGIVPLFLNRDVGGPMTRTVEDAAIVLNAIAGYDPKDPQTAVIQGVTLPDYTRFLDREGLRGARIGVVENFVNPTGDSVSIDSPDPEVLALMDRAIGTLMCQGATVKSVRLPEFSLSLLKVWTGSNTFAHDMNQYLQALGADAPMKSVEDIIAFGQCDPSVRDLLDSSVEIGDIPPESRGDFLTGEAAREIIRQAIVSVMDAGEYDALIYPTWNRPPRRIGDLSSPTGNNNFQLSPRTGFPEITVPMGFVANGTLPSGLQFFGRPFDEPMLFKLAYAYEKATQHRRPPQGFSALAGEGVESDTEMW